jgi:ribosome-interacting GTPase 1
MVIFCLLSDDRCDATADDLIDVVEGNRTYVPCIYLLNKIDQISIEELGKTYHTIALF